MKVRVPRPLGYTVFVAHRSDFVFAAAGCRLRLGAPRHRGRRINNFANRDDRSESDFHRGGSQLHADRDRDERHYRRCHRQ